MTIRPLIALSWLALATMPALAQDTAPPEALTQVGPDIWRASKLPGTRILGPDHKRIGSVKDLLVGGDGRVKFVVVGVGGLLGLGQKTVAIPFSQVKFTDPPAIGQGETAPIPNTADAAGMVGPSQSNNLGADTTGSIMARRADTPSAPDYGTIDLTGDQLKAAPDFRATAAH